MTPHLPPKRLLTILTALSCLACAWLTVPASAAVANRLEYDLTGYAGSVDSGPIPTEATPTLVPGYVTGTSITRGPGLVGAYLSQGFSSSYFSNNSNHTPLLDPTRANALAQGDYYQVQVSIISGPVSFSQLDMIGRISSAIVNWEWQYSFDGFSTAGTVLHNYLTTEIPVGGAGGPLPAINLTGVSALQDIDVGTTITLRLYGWGATGNGNTMALGRSKQLAAEGGAYVGPALAITMVPEPRYAAAFGGLAALGLLVWRRRAATR
jgi:hypothetical protein